MRDLLLSRPIRDVDLALESEALSFARRLGERIGARPRIHRRFRTATLDLASGPRLDIVEIRSETYGHPGALPRVRPGATLRDDLARRDFTIHAMAIEIAPRWRSGVVDPFGGRQDLAQGVLRLLHPGSPRDDPTRAFRAVRYANRLRFSLEPESRSWIRDAVAAGSFDAVSGDRLRQELVKIFSEEGWAAAATGMRELELSSAIHPALSQGRGFRSRLARAERLARRMHASWFSALLAWTSDLSEKEAGELAARLSLAGETGKTLRVWPRTLQELRGFARFAPGRAKVRSVGLSLEERAAAAACLQAADREALLNAIARPVALSIRGRDLLAAGARPGPRIGAALAETLAARLEGRISEEEELSFALKTIEPSS